MLAQAPSRETSSGKARFEIIGDPFIDGALLGRDVRLAWAAARAAGGSTVVGDGAGERHRYLAEFDLRYSTKDKSDTGRASDILKGMEGRRLTYRRIGSLAA